MRLLESLEAGRPQRQDVLTIPVGLFVLSDDDVVALVSVPSTTIARVSLNHRGVYIYGGVTRCRFNQLKFSTLKLKKRPMS